MNVGVKPPSNWSSKYETLDKNIVWVSNKSTNFEKSIYLCNCVLGSDYLRFPMKLPIVS